MQRAGLKGMTGPEYVYIMFTAFPSAELSAPWNSAPSTMSKDEIDTLKSYFYSMKTVC